MSSASADTIVDGGTQSRPRSGTVTYLSCYPLPGRFRDMLERDGAGPEFLTLSTLRSFPLRQVWSLLRGVTSEHFRVAITDENERVLVPLLLLLASLSRARRISTVRLPSGSPERIARPLAFLAVGHGIRATLTGYVYRGWYAARAAILLHSKPIAFLPGDGAKALYLKTNLMLGTHAGGSVGHIAGIVNELHRREAGVLVQALEFPSTVKPGVRFEQQTPLKYYGWPSESNQLRFNVNSIRAGARALSRESFDFIYQRMTVANLAGVVLSRRFRVPLVLEYNGSEVWVSKNWGLPLRWEKLAERIEQVCLRHASYVVTVSEPLRLDLIERGVPAERIVTYPNCIDPEKFDPQLYASERDRLRKSWGVADDEIVALFMGTFGAWHGAEVVADAINHWRRTRGENGKLRFVFVGDGLLAPKVRAMLKGSVEDGQTIFTGLVAQAEAPGYLAAADIFLSPHVKPEDGSRFFGSPTKLFEYMAMAKPIVASRLEQIEEVLLDQTDPPGEDLAVLVEPGSPVALIAALDELAGDPGRREALGAAARRQALRFLTWEKHVDQIMAALRSAR